MKHTYKQSAPTFYFQNQYLPAFMIFNKNDELLTLFHVETILILFYQLADSREGISLTFIVLEIESNSYNCCNM